MLGVKTKMTSWPSEKKEGEGYQAPIKCYQAPNYF
jgi:hypothetical protein